MEYQIFNVLMLILSTIFTLHCNQIYDHNPHNQKPSPAHISSTNPNFNDRPSEQHRAQIHPKCPLKISVPVLGDQIPDRHCTVPQLLSSSLAKRYVKALGDAIVKIAPHQCRKFYSPLQHMMHFCCCKSSTVQLQVEYNTDDCTTTYVLWWNRFVSNIVGWGGRWHHLRKRILSDCVLKISNDLHFTT